MPDASTQTTKGKNIFLLPKKKSFGEATVQLCWSCDTRPSTHRTYRDALDDYELTCDECHKDQYPEEYEEEEKCNTCGKNIDDDDDDKKCGEGCPEYDEGWKETHPEEEEDERYCDNDDCPYGGYIYDEELEKYRGKEYKCIGCKTGKGLQERDK